MIALRDDEILCRTAEEIPAPARGQIHPQIETRLGEVLVVLFPQFAEAFPQTSRIIDEYFERLVLIFWLSRTRNKWYQRGVIEGADTSLALDIHGGFMPPDRKNFDKHLGMLPARWLELYRWFDGLGIQSQQTLGRTAHVLPTPVSGRMDSEQFQSVKNIYFPNAPAVDDQLIGEFVTEIGAAHPFANGRAGEVRCWCLCRNGDSYWISDQDQQATVYVVHHFDFANVTTMDNPGETLDQYMASVLDPASHVAK